MSDRPDNLTADRFRAGIRQPGPAFAIFKRTLDVGVAAGVLLAVCPILGACWVWIKFRDGGPVIYRQWRVGRDGWLFVLYKLRTMRLDAEVGGQAQFARSGDPRVLPGCGWMRRSHVDELPQLWNILRGEMSLIGPRPERPEVVTSLRRRLPAIERRLGVRPGLTGLAQVRNGYTNDMAGTRRKLAFDLRYLRRPSIFQELRLLLATVPKIWDQAAL